MNTRISDKLRQAILTLARTNVQRMPKQEQADYIISLSRTFKMTPNEFLQVMKPTIARNRAKTGKAYHDSFAELVIFKSALFNARQAYRTMLAIRNGKGEVDRKPVAKAKAKPARKAVAKHEPEKASAPAPAPVAKPEDWRAHWLALGKLVFSHLG